MNDELHERSKRVRWFSVESGLTISNIRVIWFLVSDLKLRTSLHAYFLWGDVIKNCLSIEEIFVLVGQIANNREVNYRIRTAPTVYSFTVALIFYSIRILFYKSFGSQQQLNYSLFHHLKKTHTTFFLFRSYNSAYIISHHPCFMKI